MTIEKLKELVGADAVEKLVRDAATNAAREGDWEKLEEIVQFAKENELNVKPAVNKSNNTTKAGFSYEDAMEAMNRRDEKRRQEVSQRMGVKRIG